jgi:hypothetical protein
MERMSNGELEQLIATAREIIADREGTPVELPHHEVVERSKGKGGRWLQWEIVKCGKPHCSRDKDGAGHGPYAYLYHINEHTGRYTSKSVGRVLSPELIKEFGYPRSPTRPQTSQPCTPTPQTRSPETT